MESGPTEPIREAPEAESARVAIEARTVAHSGLLGLVPVSDSADRPADAAAESTAGTPAAAAPTVPDPLSDYDPNALRAAEDDPPPVVLSLPAPDPMPIPLLLLGPDLTPDAELGLTSAPDSLGGLPAAGDVAVPKSGQYGNLWDRLRAGFHLPPLDHPLIRQHMRAFASAPDDLARIVERSRRYLYFILSEVEKRGMPSEIALLPMVESAYDPRAFSRGKASGIWQFIPSTGTHYGLRQNWWYDGRRDVLTSTYSALNYLVKLHNRFGSWELALAGYNCGENRVARAIEQNAAQHLRTDYWSLPLPVETRNYVPKLLALRALVREPDRHGLWLAPIANQPYFAPVKTTRNVDLKQAAAFAGVSETEFLALNPAYNRPVIGGMGQRTILVPAQNADLFSARLRDPSATLVSWRMHVLKRGEVLDNVADHFGLSGAELKRVNGIDASRTIAGGGAILVPTRGSGSGAEPRFDSNLRPEAEVPEPQKARTHRVAPGESLGSIAALYRTTPQQLRAANRGGTRSRLVAGQVLTIPAGSGSGLVSVAAVSTAPPAASVRPRERHYTVRSGDTLFGIAHKLGIRLADLQRCNRIAPHSRLATGQVLTLPADSLE